MAAGTLIANSIVRPLVLLVDDDPSVLQALTALLAPKLEPWFRLVTAESLHEALELLDMEDDVQSPLALAISDEKMPGGNGTELLVKLRTRPGHEHGGRIIVTGYADLDSAKRAINDAEVARYFPKPWNAEQELLPAVGEVLLAFTQRRNLGRLLLAAPGNWTTARAESLALRSSWWEYVHLMGMPAAEMEVQLPEFETSTDAAATHVLVHEWSLEKRFAVAAARLRIEPTKATLEAVAFVPGAATDEAEALLLRAAQREAKRLRATRLTVEGSPLRGDFYRALGFEAKPETADTQAQVQASAEWTCDLSSMPEDVWTRRYANERRLCACAQTGCPARDYDAPRRGYVCPLDLIEHRVPPGFPLVPAGQPG